VHIEVSLAEKYWDVFIKCRADLTQDLKALGKTDDEILKEFITSAYVYGYMNGKYEKH